MPGQKDNRKPKNPFVVRRQRAALLRAAVQVAFFIVAPSVFSSAFAGVKEICTAFGGGAVLAWSGFMAMLVLTLGFTIVFGRFFCGYGCAFGAVGDWLYALSDFVQKKTKRKLPQIPMGIQKYLQYLKFVILALILLLCVLGRQEAVNGNSPWTVFSLLRSGRGIPGGYAVAVTLLIVILIGMVFQERFFCQFLCPMGAIFSLMPVIPFVGQLKRGESCIPTCSACERMCPVSLKLEENSLRSGECITCGRCVNTCPRENITCMNGLLKGTEWWFVLARAAALMAGILLVQ